MLRPRNQGPLPKPMGTITPLRDLRELEAAFRLHDQVFTPGSPDHLSRKAFLDLTQGAGTTILGLPLATGEMAGYILWRQVVDEAELLSIAVYHGVRQKGLGRQMLGRMIGQLKKGGVKTIFLEVAEDNKAAISLYETFGATTVGTRKGYFKGPQGTPKDALLQKIPLC